MLLDKYYKEIEAIGPSEEQMERLLASLWEQKAPVTRRFPLRHALAAAALCAMLTLTALAVSPGLREALAAALGLFAPYSQTIEGLSVVDQGIEVRVVSAISDGNVAQVYYTIRDLAGDRLDEYTQDDVMAPLPRNWGKGGDVDWVAGGSTAVGGLIEYDPEAKTALMVGAVRGDGPAAERLILGLDITKIQPGARHESIPINPAWIAAEPLKSLTLKNGKSVLAPSQNPHPLESEFFSLSSYGFGEDGMLHLQFRVKEGVDDSQWEIAYDDVRYSGGTSRSDTAPYYLRTSRYVQTTNYKGMTAEERELASPSTCFQKDGITYYDMRTGITPIDIAEDDVEWVEDANVWLNTRPAIKGEWSLDVPVEMVEKVNVDMAPSQTVLADVEAVSLHLSVLGCTLESDPHGAAGTLNYPLTVYLSDGSILPIGHADGLFHAGGYAVNHWSFPEPVEPGEVTAVAIGLWYVPIQDGAAQPGYWLPELPK